MKTDFIYDVEGDNILSPGNVLIDGDGSFKITGITADGLDVSGYLEQWAYDALLRLPFDLPAYYSTGQGGNTEPEYISIQINNLEIENNDGETFLDFTPEVPLDTTFPGISAPGQLFLELGLKARPQSRPCGGYETMEVSKLFNPDCTNSCTFRNVVTGREIKFNNIDLGTYEFQFEGPNEQYEIIWNTPVGENCNPERVKVLNRVEGNTLKLEDYGNDPPENWNFTDLMITITHGSYQWAGGDEDPVFYTTSNNGALCGPGYICSGGNCVKDGGSGLLDYDDIFLLHDGNSDSLYQVRAGNYMSRLNTGYNIPITRGNTTYHTSALSLSTIEDTDYIPVYRPNDSQAYKLSGEDFKNEFSYQRDLVPAVKNVSVRYKDGGDKKGISGQSFVVDIEAEPNSERTEYWILPRILGKPFDYNFCNTKLNIFLNPLSDYGWYNWADGDREGSRSIYVVGDITQEFDITVDSVWTQPATGCTLEANIQVIRNLEKHGWQSNYTLSSGNVRTQSIESLIGDVSYTDAFVYDFTGFSTTRSSVWIRLKSFTSTYNGEGSATKGYATFEGPECLQSLFPELGDDFRDENFKPGKCGISKQDGGFITNPPPNWYLKSADWDNKTAVFDWNESKPINKDNDEWHASFMNAINNNFSQYGDPSDPDWYPQGQDNWPILRYSAENAIPSNWFMSLGEEKGIATVGSFHKVEQGLSYEWTMPANVKVDNGVEFESNIENARLQVDVFARNSRGQSRWVASNYLDLI